ncbi:hypothetical protein HGRIS_006008 [Hohenbuehelia grisea]|uniref:Carboxylic ester hydrolase n=1 Tax=Hohenbuehelia grisea TaxID=104357 RepID=A0ABR3K141_9AGAR
MAVVPPLSMTPWILLSLLFANSAFSLPNVTLSGGIKVVGRSFDAVNQEVFRGIPYAEPPVASLRFKPPVPKHNFASSTINATAFGASCLQPAAEILNLEKLSEDCLTVNVQRPSGLSSSAKLPVMVWIHGGSFHSGAGADSRINATNLVSQSVARGTPIIYVNFNYRLGPLGFPVGPEAERHGALNLGLKDQLLAIKWINQNIGFFGGDKSKVTLYGQSAGSMSVASLMVNPGLKNLVRAAILESGVGFVAMPCGGTCKQAETGWNNFVRQLPECQGSTINTLACVRDKASEASLLKAILATSSWYDPVVIFSPVVDGPGGFLPAQPSQLFAQGKHVRIPVISGTNLDEGTSFAPSETNSTKSIVDWMKTLFRPTRALDRALPGLLERYPDIPALGSPHNTGNETFGLSSQFKRLSSILGDVVFAAPHRALNQKLTEQGVDVYGYLFSDRGVQTEQWPYLGVSHSYDLPYVYGNAHANATSSSRVLTTQMVDYWISFATSLKPNDGRGSQRPAWPKYGRRKPSILELNGEGIRTITDNFRAKGIDYITSHSEAFHG